MIFERQHVGKGDRLRHGSGIKGITSERPLEPQFELADTILDNVHKPRSCSNYSDVLRSSQKLKIVWEP